MLFVKILCFISVYMIDNSHATTHWMVTESGLIKPRHESPFELARPYDLLSFLNQETHWEDIINLYHELSTRRTVISELWSELYQATDVGANVLVDKNCIDIGSLSSVDWYLSYIDDGSTRNIPKQDFLLRNGYYGLDKDVPDCKKISSLTFSMFAFDHLESVVNRVNLTINPEPGQVPSQISSAMNTDQFGHWITMVLKKNSSSWLHYNMASLFWRIRGNAPKAIECCRRALHYAPRNFKDIPLLSLGIILHRSQATEDGITVLNAAVDHNPNYYLNHFMLANAYAVYGDFNNSIAHIQSTVELKPMDITVKYKNAIFCYSKLIKKMDSIKTSLNKLHEDLKEYSEKEAHWLKAQGAFLITMKHTEEFDHTNMEKNCQKMSELTGFDIKTLQSHGDKNALIKYFLDGPMYKKEWLEVKGVNAIESLYSVQNLLKHIEKHSTMASDFVINPDALKQRIVIDSARKDILETISAENVKHTDIPGVKVDAPQASENKSESYEDISEYESGYMMYPPTMKVSRNSMEFDKDPGWPSDKLCMDSAPDFPPNVEAVFPVFLPFENKGIRMKGLLNDKIGAPLSTEHELPWHPPVCPQDKESANFIPKKSQKQPFAVQVGNTGYLRQKLLEYVGDGIAEDAIHMQDAEIGHRIYAATQMNVAPKWMVLTLASLYWRVRGNNINALQCLFSANRRAPVRYRDLVLVSLASVYLEMGCFDEAMVAAEEAFRLSMYEPSTNFLLAEMNMLKKHYSTLMFHLKQVIRVESDFMDGLGRNLLYAWGCIFKQVHKPLRKPLGGICTQVEPGMNVVCEKNGDNCHMTNKQCDQDGDNEAGSLTRMMHDGKDLPSEVDKELFQRVVDGMPADRGDLAAHRRHYADMLAAMDSGLLGCGPQGCDGLTPEYIGTNEEDCTYTHLQLGFWLQVVSFKQLMTDSRLQLLAEVATLTASTKQFPDCKLPVDPEKDFFLEKMLKVHSERWEPTVSLMHQLAEMFEYFDYVTLGAKLAKYVETNPKSWAGQFAAGWWCGAGGRGPCAVRCLAAAHAHAPRDAAALPLRALSALLQMQQRPLEAKEMAYLSFYMSPKNPLEAFVAAVAHSYLDEYEQAIWMYRYALEFDERFLPAKACLHATLCLMFYGDAIRSQAGTLSL